MAVQKQSLNILCFLALTALFSSFFWTLIISAGHVGAGRGLYVAGLMWCPAFAAVATVRLRHLDWESLGLRWGGARFALFSYLTPLAYAAIGYALIWSFGFGFFPDPAAIAAIAQKLDWTITAPAAFLPLYFLLVGTTQMISSVAHALGEEIGWRGFLTPLMVQRLGFTGGSVLVGLIWAAWHMPLLLFADYNSGTPWWVSMPCFTALTVGSSVIMTWFRLASNSVWPAAILHASHNLFIQGFFTPLTGARGDVTAYVIDEFGVAVPLIIVLFAIGFWLNRKAALTAVHA
ncbi:MAG TPA: type II CAAX endopeptidase family protein [Steroidobacteraceae bacterium]|jgi:membrane protease YdiL (CAAX protease family)|nr:type II CAAX endopeptidase family protein [Steroidobacteraceae bacterium]